MTHSTHTTPANRFLPLKHCFNSRDLGGIINREGVAIARKRLVRSDDLSSLDQRDQELLSALNVHTVIDFRSHTERAAQPNVLPTSCHHDVHLDLLSGNMGTYMGMMQQQHVSSREIMLSIYQDLVLHPTSQQQYRQFFALLQQPATQGAMLYHCSAGKDRTGIATALILSALNFDEEVIMHDYLLSNEGLQEKYAHLITAYPHMRDFFMVKADWLQHAWQLIKQQYDSIENYLETVLHVNCQRLQQLYLGE